MSISIGGLVLKPFGFAFLSHSHCLFQACVLKYDESTVYITSDDGRSAQSINRSEIGNIQHNPWLQLPKQAINYEFRAIAVGILLYIVSFIFFHLEMEVFSNIIIRIGSTLTVIGGVMFLSLYYYLQ